ncbi:hypothetical protein PY247_11185 [Acinetobacter proteolyticus]|nr:hypothetical protein [Acinetobacter proteolyticus]WEI17125.1 hypothetical protein PY247_11185 [Acinetobacter proteolyticus]
MNTDITLIRLIDAMNERPVAFNRHYVALGCGITGALMLSQMVYWSKKSNADGWFYKTIEQWEEETGLSRYEQEGARKKLRDLGFIVEAKRGVPCKVYFKVDQKILYKALIKLASKPEEIEQNTAENADGSVCGNSTNQYAEIPQTGLQQTNKLDCGNTPNSDAENQQTNTESTQRVQQRSKNTFADDFEKFWSVFPSCPRKTKKSEASKTFEKHKSNFDLNSLLAILELQKKSDDWIKNDGQFIPAPQAWLNQRQWENDFWVNRLNQNTSQSLNAQQEQQPARFQPERVQFGQGLV